MKVLSLKAPALAVWLLTIAVAAHSAATLEPSNVVQLSANASVQVPQDLLTITLSTTREGPDAAWVQTQIKQALEASLALAKKQAAPGAMDVRTGSFSLQPRYGRDGRISAWVGTAELVLEGRDAERIATTAGKVQGMTVSSAQFSLSREQRQAVETQVQAAAIERFRVRALDVAKSFGFGGYTLREVSVLAADTGFVPKARMMYAAEARAMSADAPMPVEAGKAEVQVTVQGSVQLQK